MRESAATSPAAPEAGTEDRRTTRPTTLLEVSNAIVRLMKAHYGKGPTSVRTHLLDDAVVVLTRGGFTQVEHTLVELGQEAAVLEQRRIFKLAMTERFREVVSDATGREVVAVLSATHVAPDLGCETFVLAPEGDGASGA
jgi:uncharacterized protein YbcI